MSSSDRESRHGGNKESINVAATDALVADGHSGQIDGAWKFLDGHRDATAVDGIDMKALRRRIDFRIVPLMFLCYTLQFLDKVILNVRAHLIDFLASTDYMRVSLFPLHG